MSDGPRCPRCGLPLTVRRRERVTEWLVAVLAECFVCEEPSRRKVKPPLQVWCLAAEEATAA